MGRSCARDHSLRTGKARPAGRQRAAATPRVRCGRRGTTATARAGTAARTSQTTACRETEVEQGTGGHAADEDDQAGDGGQRADGEADPAVLREVGHPCTGGWDDQHLLH